MLSIEIGDIDYAISRINSIERKFKELLIQPHNIRKKEFIKILRNIIKVEDYWRSPISKEEAWKFILIQPIYNTGIEFISFNAWLYSKLENVPYSEAGYNKIIKKKIKNGELALH